MKGQAATEFLMTYGWALLVVLVAISALAYFGVMSPSKFLPEKCMLSPGYQCVDYLITTNSSRMIIKNGAGDNIVITNLKIGECEGNFSTTIENGKQEDFLLTGCNNGVEGSSFRGEVSVEYINVISNFTKEITGEVVTKIN